MSNGQTPTSSRVVDLAAVQILVRTLNSPEHQSDNHDLATYYVSAPPPVAEVADTARGAVGKGGGRCRRLPQGSTASVWKVTVLSRCCRMRQRPDRQVEAGRGR